MQKNSGKLYAADSDLYCLGSNPSSAVGGTALRLGPFLRLHIYARA